MLSLCVKHPSGSQGEGGTHRISLYTSHTDHWHAVLVPLAPANGAAKYLHRRAWIQVLKGSEYLSRWVVPSFLRAEVSWAALAGVNRVTNTEELSPQSASRAKPGLVALMHSSTGLIKAFIIPETLSDPWVVQEPSVPS